MTGHIECRATLSTRETRDGEHLGSILTLVAPGRRGYVTIDSDIDPDQPAVCGMVSDRETGHVWAKELKTPQDFDWFLGEALAFLSGEPVKCPGGGGTEDLLCAHDVLKKP